MTWRRICCAATLLVVCLLLACRHEEVPSVDLGPPVSVARVEARALADRILVTGQLLAVNEASVAAEVEGRISSIVVDEGSGAEAGAIILEIDPEGRQLELDTARATVEQARALLEQQQRETDRINQLHSNHAASKSQLDAGEANLRLAWARLVAALSGLGMAERAHRNASVKAPFTGVIARRHVSEGEFVKSGQELFDLVSYDPIEMEFHVPERDSGRIRKGQHLDVRVAPYPDELFKASVTMVSPRIDPRTRTLRIKARIDNRAGRLRPGLFARADLGIRERSNVIMIQASAILQRSDGSVVYRMLEDGRVERQLVRTGVFESRDVEILEGLEVGDTIVVRGQSRLMDGSTVDVVSGPPGRTASLADRIGESRE